MSIDTSESHVYANAHIYGLTSRFESVSNQKGLLQPSAEEHNEIINFGYDVLNTTTDAIENGDNKQDYEFAVKLYHEHAQAFINQASARITSRDLYIQFVANMFISQYASLFWFWAENYDHIDQCLLEKLGLKTDELSLFKEAIKNQFIEHTPERFATLFDSLGFIFYLFPEEDLNSWVYHHSVSIGFENLMSRIPGLYFKRKKALGKIVPKNIWYSWWRNLNQTEKQKYHNNPELLFGFTSENTWPEPLESIRNNPRIKIEVDKNLQKVEHSLKVPDITVLAGELEIAPDIVSKRTEDKNVISKALTQQYQNPSKEPKKAQQFWDELSNKMTLPALMYLNIPESDDAMAQWYFKMYEETLVHNAALAFSGLQPANIDTITDVEMVYSGAMYAAEINQRRATAENLTSKRIQRLYHSYKGVFHDEIKNFDALFTHFEFKSGIIKEFIANVIQAGYIKKEERMVANLFDGQVNGTDLKGSPKREVTMKKKVFLEPVNIDINTLKTHCIKHFENQINALAKEEIRKKLGSKTDRSYWQENPFLILGTAVDNVPKDDPKIVPCLVDALSVCLMMNVDSAIPLNHNLTELNKRFIWEAWCRKYQSRLKRDSETRKLFFQFWGMTPIPDELKRYVFTDTDLAPNHVLVVPPKLAIPNFTVTSQQKDNAVTFELTGIPEDDILGYTLVITEPGKGKRGHRKERFREDVTNPMFVINDDLEGCTISVIAQLDPEKYITPSSQPATIITIPKTKKDPLKNAVKRHRTKLTEINQPLIDALESALYGEFDTVVSDDLKTVTLTPKNQFEGFVNDSLVVAFKSGKGEITQYLTAENEPGTRRLWPEFINLATSQRQEKIDAQKAAKAQEADEKRKANILANRDAHRKEIQVARKLWNKGEAAKSRRIFHNQAEIFKQIPHVSGENSLKGSFITVTEKPGFVWDLVWRYPKTKPDFKRAIAPYLKGARILGINLKLSQSNASPLPFTGKVEIDGQTVSFMFSTDLKLQCDFSGIMTNQPLKNKVSTVLTNLCQSLLLQSMKTAPTAFKVVAYEDIQADINRKKREAEKELSDEEKAKEEKRLQTLITHGVNQVKGNRAYIFTRTREEEGVIRQAHSLKKLLEMYQSDEPAKQNFIKMTQVAVRRSKLNFHTKPDNSSSEPQTAKAITFLAHEKNERYLWRRILANAKNILGSVSNKRDKTVLPEECFKALYKSAVENGLISGTKEVKEHGKTKEVEKTIEELETDFWFFMQPYTEADNQNTDGLTSISAELQKSHPFFMEDFIRQAANTEGLQIEYESEVTVDLEDVLNSILAEECHSES